MGAMDTPHAAFRAAIAAFAVSVAAAPSIAEAQCEAPTFRFSPTITHNQSFSDFVLTPRGALGEGVAVGDLSAYVAQERLWIRGEGAPPRLQAPADTMMSGDFKPIIEDGMFISEDLINLPSLIAAGNEFLELLRNRADISRVVGGDNGVPIELLPTSPRRPPPMRVPVQPLSGGAQVVSVDANDAVVGITFGSGGFCNGVHVGRGRILTNLHCALDAGPRRVLFGAVAWNTDKLDGELNCWAQRITPLTTSGGTAVDFAVLDIGAGGALPHMFTASRFGDAYFRPSAADDVWRAQSSPLIAIQIYPAYAVNSTRFQRRVEDGRWQGSRCQAFAQAPEQRLASNNCMPDRPRPEIINDGRGHGCDTLPGSSGAPLFVETTSGGLELVGLHRMGAGPGDDESQDPTHQNWNCAVPSYWFAGAIPIN